MLNYDRLSRIFSCLLLTRNHMISLVQFGINKHLLIFSNITNCTRPTGSYNFFSLWKNLLVLIYSKLHSKSCDYLYKCEFLLSTFNVNIYVREKWKCYNVLWITWHIENEIKQEKGTEAPALKIGRQLIPKVNKNKIENSEGSAAFSSYLFSNATIRSAY